MKVTTLTNQELKVALATSLAVLGLEGPFAKLINEAMYRLGPDAEGLDKHQRVCKENYISRGKISTIKLLRELEDSLGLPKAKEIIERWAREGNWKTSYDR